jgi:CheY-like chemotaxis protein
MRLDKILLDERMATKSQIDEVINYQRHHGGRLETHLLRFGYTKEAELSRALARQFGCESVNLSEIDIPDSVLDLIPADVAWGKLVLPFEYDPVHNILRIACENPSDEKLAEELNSIAHGRTVRLYVAVGAVLKCRILDHYRGLPGNVRDEDTRADYSLETCHVMVTENKSACRVLILNKTQGNIEMLEQYLKGNDFKTTASYSINQFLNLYRNEQPDILILLVDSDIEQIQNLVSELGRVGIAVDEIPTVLLLEQPNIVEQTLLLKAGFEEVLPAAGNYDLLVIRLNRIRNRLKSESRQREEIIQNLGTHGSLGDINIIDLLQAMGPSRRTARVSITGSGKHLTIFLDRGNIIYAECEGKTGAEAVYQGLPWTRGIWSVDPIDPDELPEPNNDLSNDIILLEGCRLMDEQKRNESDTSSNFDW